MDQELARSLGEKLKNVREEKGLPLKKIEEETFISLRYLKALEEGRWNELPGKAYILGYIKKYSRLLDLDENEVVAQAKQVFTETHLSSKDKEETASLSLPAARPKSHFFQRILIYLVVLAAFFAVLFVVFSLPSFTSIPSSQPTETEAPTEPVATTPLPQPEETPQFALHLLLLPEDMAWVEITHQAQTVFQGVLVPGKQYLFKANTPLTLSGVNGSQVRIQINGEDAGYLSVAEGDFSRTINP